MEKKKLILTSFTKVIIYLKKAISQPKNEYTRDATIQRIKCAYELSWKLLRRVLSDEYGVIEFHIKNLYREAGRQNLIEDVEKWISFYTVRNLTSHTYNEQTADETYATAKQFVIEAEKLLYKLQTLLGYEHQTNI